MNPKKNHQFNRKAVTHVKCLRCGLEQPKGKTCSGCQKDFAVYFCDVCNLYDDLGDKKGIYHCDKCGICRVGGKDNLYHCDSCGCCMNKTMENNHKCMNKRIDYDCPVCFADLHTSR